MPEKDQYPFDVAKPIAERLADLLRPATEGIAIAGSIRRCRLDIGDVELLYLPRWGEQPKDQRQPSLFGDVELVDAIDSVLEILIEKGALEKRRRGDGGVLGYGELNKYLRESHAGMPVDVFRTTPANWGMAYMVRTGPAIWNETMMRRLRVMGLKGHAYGGVERNGETVECPDELRVFDLLNFPYVAPERRDDPDVIKELGGLAARRMAKKGG